MRVENAIRDEVCRQAKKNGWVERLLGWKGKRGAPDTFFAKDGKVILVEFKSPGEVPREDQMVEHKALRDAGVDTRVWSSITQGLRELGITA